MLKNFGLVAGGVVLGVWGTLLWGNRESAQIARAVERVQLSDPFGRAQLMLPDGIPLKLAPSCIKVAAECGDEVRLQYEEHFKRAWDASR